MTTTQTARQIAEAIADDVLAKIRSTRTGATSQQIGQWAGEAARHTGNHLYGVLVLRALKDRDLVRVVKDRHGIERVIAK